MTDHAVGATILFFRRRKSDPGDGDFGAMEGNRVESRQGRSISPEIHDGADDIRRTALVYREMFDRLTVLAETK